MAKPCDFCKKQRECFLLNMLEIEEGVQGVCINKDFANNFNSAEYGIHRMAQ